MLVVDWRETRTWRDGEEARVRLNRRASYETMFAIYTHQLPLHYLANFRKQVPVLTNL